eukprot:3806798-Alexandrium_andersonii.AAC.1
MSASLVGSEMCIRDRRLMHRTAVVGILLPRATWSRSRAQANRLAGTRTVSYTHLTLPTICSV